MEMEVAEGTDPEEISQKIVVWQEVYTSVRPSVYLIIHPSENFVWYNEHTNYLKESKIPQRDKL